MQGQVEVSYPSNSVTSNRPFAIQKLFINRKPTELVQLVGLSYSLCGQAQKFTANSVLNLLTEQETFNALDLVMVESLREHLLSIVQMLQKLNLINQAEQIAFMSGVGRWVPRFKAAKTAEEQQVVVDEILVEYEKLIDGQNWLECFSAIEAKPKDSIELPGLLGLLMQALSVDFKTESASVDITKSQLHAINHDVLFINLNSMNWHEWASKPEVEGRAIENSAFSRIAQGSNEWGELAKKAPLKTRLLARFVDIKQHLEALLSKDHSQSFKNKLFGKATVSDSEQIAWVETARGRLYHFAQTQGVDEPVQSYVISAPTEWNFHPQGVAGSLISNLKTSSHEQWKTEVSMIAQIIDPCVPLAFIEEQMHA